MGGRGSRARTFSGRREVAIGLGMYAMYLLVRTAVVTTAAVRKPAGTRSGSWWPSDGFGSMWSQSSSRCCCRGRA